jgi:uncharacterized protein with FMN-binding domain
MKRIGVFLISLIAVCSFSACYGKISNKPNTGNNTSINQGTSQGYNIDQGSLRTAYRDGTYTGYGDMMSSGNNFATVFISGGRITSLTLGYTDLKGSKVVSPNGDGTLPIDRMKNNSSQYGGTTGNGNTGAGMPNGISSGGRVPGAADLRADLTNAIIQNQTYDVNIPSGNTKEINNWKLAVKRALDKSKK